MSAAEGAVLLLGMGSQGRPYLSAARRLGLEVCVVDRSAALRSPKTQRLLDHAVSTVGLDEPAGVAHWYAAARAVARSRPLRGVVAFTEEHVVPAAMLADELGLPSPGLRSALTSRNKATQRAVLAAQGVPQPGWIAPQVRDEAHDWLRGRPSAVAKPVDRAGSSGVRLVRGPDELDAWFEEEGRPTEYLVEEFVPGAELSVELLLRDGVVVFTNLTEKTTTAPPFFVETGHEAPADLSADVAAAVADAATRAVRATGMATGVAHVEVRLDGSGEPRVIELAVRTPGDHIMELVGAAWDVDLFELVVRLQCALPVDVPDRPARRAQVLYVPGAVARGVDLARLAEEHSCQVVLSSLDATHRAEVNDGAWRDSSSRGGAVLLSAVRREDLRAVRTALLGDGEGGDR